ncbi:MAG: DUF952 domain-containing protein [Chitinophagaceae bacterium]|nr:MAG: DUF952 domain-containing protein [Chitinophagaceae bacterium]
MPIIYHVTTNDAWQKAIEKGVYETDSLINEGFIHCSQEEQVNGVLVRYYAGKNDLVKLKIDTDSLTSRLIYEWSPSTADTFPHVYGPINIEAVLSAETIN